MMKYLKLFATDNNRLSYEDSGNYVEPYVSLIEGNNSVYYNKSSRGGDSEKERFAISIDEHNVRYAVGYIEDNCVYIDSVVNNNVMLMTSSGIFQNNLELKEEYKTLFIAKISHDVETVTDMILVTVSGISIGDEYPNFENLPKYNW